MLLQLSLRLLAHVLGTALHLFLSVLLARRKNAGLVEKLALATMAAGGLWHLANAIAIFHRAAAAQNSPALLWILDQVSIAALAVLPALLLHVELAWAGAPRWAGFLGYGLAPLAWWALESREGQLYAICIGTVLIAVTVLSLIAASRAPVLSTRHFHRTLAAGLLAIPALGSIFGAGSLPVIAASLAPPSVLAYFVYRYNVLGLLISRRITFVLKLGAIFALYLLIVRQLASIVEDAFEVFGRVVEVALIFAAALVWIPLYGWINRFLSRRAGLYADFSKRLIEEAAGILDMRERVQFLAEEVGRSFKVHRALLVTVGEATLLGEFGSDQRGMTGLGPQWRHMMEAARARRLEMIHAVTTADREVAQALNAVGFNYLIPLWYEDHLTGLLLLDTSPRMFLDEDESLLLGLSRQISHSIETGRLIDDKIGLERALARQEHLATLGKAAATIAHEVKNPLSSISALAQVMRQDPSMERYDRDLGFILSEVDRLSRTVQQLLHFSRPAPQGEAEVNLSELLETTTGVLARQYAVEQIRVEQHIEPELRLKQASIEALKQIVFNLILNAAQASAPNGIVCVTASAKPDGFISIAVADEGPGIPPELREKVFEPFFTTKQKGTGLGLAIVKKNVQQLRGELHLESPIADGRGTRVTVVVPTG